ncbi:hypothetical protein H8E88_11210 [candidate division KSB1 bacterium]|nr:hypothetical protein [candidate division KSB1 bacterium]MBL7093022.1 hypothetical protein [candidate division KSB1 bacterium]
MEFTDELIGQLKTCPKEIVQSPGKPRLDRGYYRIGFELQSVDQEFFFIAFGRYNLMFPENFSIGLVYSPRHEKGSYEILRCNGPHGEHEMFPHHVHFHIHEITTAAMENGLKEDRNIEITDKYTNFDDALRFFCETH